MLSIRGRLVRRDKRLLHSQELSSDELIQEIFPKKCTRRPHRALGLGNTRIPGVRYSHADIFVQTSWRRGGAGSAA